MNAAMPAWATSPTHERSSAESARYQSCAASIRRVAADESSPADRSTRCRVAVDVLTRVDGIPGVYLYAAHNGWVRRPRHREGGSGPAQPAFHAKHPRSRAPGAASRLQSFTVRRRGWVGAVLCAVLMVLGTALGTVLTAGTAQAGPLTARSIAPRPLVVKPLVIGHRGASGYRPEHTLAAYRLAVQQGADAFDVDVVSSRDHELVVVHDVEIGGVTDVAEHAEFADRKTTKAVNGITSTGWFVDDFTLTELKTLRVRERMPAIRPKNTALRRTVRDPDAGRGAQPAGRSCSPPPAGPSRSIPSSRTRPTSGPLDLDLEGPLAAALKSAGLGTATAPAWVQSFELTSLSRLRDGYGLRTRMVLLTSGTGRPYDFEVSGDSRTYADLLTTTGLAELARTVSAIGPDQSQVLPRRADGTLGTATTLVARVHAAGLLVHVYTMRSENIFLPVDYRVGPDPAAAGRAVLFDSRMLGAGVDGMFCDQPDLCVAARATVPPRVVRTWSPPRRR